MIKLQNVRLGAFPALFNKPVFNGEPQDKYNCKLLLDPEEHADEIAAIKDEIKSLSQERWKGAKLPSDKYCLRSGEDTGKDYNDGYFVLSASTKQRPVVVDRRKAQITEEDGVIYAGCRVNAAVSLWVMDNSYGKRICAELEGVQFVADDDPIEAGGGRSAAQRLEAFDSLDDEDDDDMFAVA